MAGDGPERPKLSARDVWSLIFSTYRTSLPILLLIIAVMLLATWFVTTVLF